MRVLITGNKGFIGREVERKLVSVGFQTTGYDITDGFDILNADLLTQSAAGCKYIVHLAAIEGQAPVKVMETNLLGTWNVLCAAKETNVEKIIYISSVDALGIFQGEGIPKYLPLDDDYPCHPSAVYSISKKLAEEMCRYFSESTGIPVICLRPPGVWDDSTYRIITIARKERPEYEWEPYWEYGAFLDVRDLADVILASIENIKNGYHCLLVASDDITTSGLSSLELVHKIHPCVKWKGDKEYELNPFKSLVNTDKAKSILQWSPKYSWRRFWEESKV
ncbi:MAG: NAD(P)-dependent oxidoreductase [Ignavibacteriae bacterium]|nr:MAG: NAD(P)-dependent oxidoreductase [Ignavibacteriota bacterium]